KREEPETCAIDSVRAGSLRRRGMATLMRGSCLAPIERHQLPARLLRQLTVDAAWRDTDTVVDAAGNESEFRRWVFMLDSATGPLLARGLTRVGRKYVILPGRLASVAPIDTWCEALAGLSGVLVAGEAPAEFIELLPRASELLLNAESGSSC